ncbi:hypothetical protein CDQ91_08995 [Sphingopyxis witflariensis]|uniref:Uncharacterized protein n=1 Tax=Sphingopyxis witflariensis TaxID=173675 RepID=A0A246JXG4_9SPHN|nr:hypothetical protein CDQ91_08995 [Sphingopyxis witflariensis]
MADDAINMADQSHGKGPLMPHGRFIPLATLLGCTLTASIAVSAADPPAAPEPAKPATTASARDGKPKLRDPNEIICRKEQVLGSRLETKRRCMTRSEWAEANRVTRGELERAQVQRGTSAQ